MIDVPRSALLRLVEAGEVPATMVAGRWAIASEEVARQAAYRPFVHDQGKQPPLLVVVPSTPRRRQEAALAA